MVTSHQRHGTAPTGGPKSGLGVLSLGKGKLQRRGKEEPVIVCWSGENGYGPNHSFPKQAVAGGGRSSRNRTMAVVNLYTVLESG